MFKISTVIHRILGIDIQDAIIDKPVPVSTKDEYNIADTVREISTISASIVDSINSKECRLEAPGANPDEKYKCLSVLYDAINDSEDIICMTDYHSRIIYVNKTYLTTYGFISSQDVIGRYARIVGAGITSKEVFQGMWSTIRQGKSWVGKITNRTTTGEIVEVNSSIIPINSPTGEIDYFICVQKPTKQVERLLWKP